MEALFAKLPLIEGSEESFNKASIKGEIGDIALDVETITPPSSIEHYLYFFPRVSQLVHYSADLGITHSMKVVKLAIRNGGDIAPYFHFDLILPGEDLIVSLVNLVPGEELEIAALESGREGAMVELFMYCENGRGSIRFRPAPVEGNRMSCNAMSFETTSDSIFIEGSIDFDLLMSEDALEAEEYLPVNGECTFRIAEAL